MHLRHGTLLTFLVSIGILLAARPLLAQHACVPLPNGLQECMIGIPVAELRDAEGTQEKELWCWAASIQNLFAAWGYKVSQTEIVTKAKGWPVNRSAYGFEITRQLNGKTWKDSNGRTFTTSVSVYDLVTGRNQVGFKEIIKHIGTQRPMIVGARSHSCMITSLKYIADARGNPLGIKNVLIWDPWPPGERREMRIDEAANTLYLAAVKIDGEIDDGMEAEHQRRVDECMENCDEGYEACSNDLDEISDECDNQCDRMFCDFCYRLMNPIQADLCERNCERCQHRCKETVESRKRQCEGTKRLCTRNCENIP